MTTASRSLLLLHSTVFRRLAQGCRGILACHRTIPFFARYLEKYPEDADKIVLIVKGGTDIAASGFVVDSSSKNIRRSINASLARS
ncbi:putative pyridoxine 4-dehydrogenase [Microsporum audouinii]